MMNLAQNTQLNYKGKYHCTSDLLFSKFALNQTGY